MFFVPHSGVVRWARSMIRSLTALAALSVMFAFASQAVAQVCSPTSNRVTSGTFATTGGNTNTVTGWTVGGTYASSGAWVSPVGRVNLGSNGLIFQRDTSTVTTLSQSVTQIYNGTAIQISGLRWIKTLTTNATSRAVLTISYAGTVYATIDTTTTGLPRTPTVTASAGASVNMTTLQSLNGAGYVTSSPVNLTITLPDGVPQSGSLLFTFTAASDLGEVNDITMSSVAMSSCVIAIAPGSEPGTATFGLASTPIANVRSNDTVNGAAATAANSTIATSGTWPAGITLDTTTGAISVGSSVTPGTYSVTYQLCDMNSPANCNTVTDTITVTSVVTPVTESGTAVSGTASTPVANVVANDTINGVAATLGSGGNATVATSGTWPAGTSLNTTTGAISVTSSVASGTYILTYQLCDKLSPVTCNTATDTVTVSPSVDLVITKSDGQGSSFPGDTLNYSVTVRNNGPDAAVGPIVVDVPGVGLTCPSSNVVTITGAGVPAGSFTIANLTGAGITLGTLSAGQTATLTYSCTVN